LSFVLAPGKNRFKCKDYVCIKLAPNGLSKAQTCYATRHGIAIRPVGSHRIVGICYSDNPRKKWDFVPSEAVGVSLAVDSLVMVADYSRNLCVVINLREDPLSNLRMLFHLPPLGKREWSGLFK